MNINKAHWVTEGDNVRLSMPIGKVDVERRTVSGFATLDNVDRQGDIVDTSASIEAFNNFRGNLREMHQPSAVGKIASFKEDRYFDPASKKFYSGVYVSAYVSKGAQDAWEKVLDGTYSGFSIGGNIKDYEDKYDESLDKSVRVIKSYDLYELSLVDSPANQFANVFSIEKVDGKDEISGYLSKTEIENVFWDSENDIVLLSESDSAVSPTSGKPMQNIGFVEKADANNSDTIKFLVDSAKGINTEINKEVSPMTDATNEVVAEATEEVVEAPAVEESQVAPEAEAAPAEDVAVEKSTDVDKNDMPGTGVQEDSDDEDEEDEMESEEPVMDATKSEVVNKSDELLNESIIEIKETVSKAFSDLSETVKSLYEHVSELSKSLTAVKDEVTATKGEFDNFGKRIDAVAADTAFRKSGDLGEIVQELPEMKVQKSLWDGRFLTNTDLYN
jgi:hypothetical protein